MFHQGDIIHTMKKYSEDFTVRANIALNSGHHILELQSPVPLPQMVPGQFVELKVDGSPNTYLRRPFSIHRVNYEQNTISLLIKIVGDGTRQLKTLKPSDKVNMLFPLGKGFSLPENKKVLLVGGGCGVAPLFYLADELFKRKNNITILIGGRTSNDILLADEYKQFGEVLITTEDGSIGEKGMATTHSFLKNNPVLDQIYCCGPDGMMRAVSNIAGLINVPCEVSLENTMACGIGVCLCCVVESNHGNICVCTEGPVFNSSVLKGWSRETEIGCSLS